jgi:hypothetical protein
MYNVVMNIEHQKHNLKEEYIGEVDLYSMRKILDTDFKKKDNIKILDLISIPTDYSENPISSLIFYINILLNINIVFNIEDDY